MPALNSAKYIHKCMESVVNQTLREIEIIPVDAGSTDGTWEVFQEYAAKDERIKPIHSDKKSMGYQYNIGMDAATGKYIGFVETDDFVPPDMFEKLYEAAEETNVDWVKADFDLFVDMPEHILVTIPRFRPERRVLYNQVLKATDYPDLIMEETYMWPGIYRREFLLTNRIRLNETLGAAFQDTGFVRQSLMFADKIMYLNQSFYKYRRDNNLSSAYNPEGIRYMLQEIQFLLSILAKNPAVGGFYETILFERFSKDFLILYEKLLPLKMLTGSQMNILHDYCFILQEAYQKGKLSLRYLSEHPNLNLAFISLEQFDFGIRKNISFRTNLLNSFLKNVKRYTQVVIFGCGTNGASLYFFLKNNGVTISGACDNSKAKWGTSFMKMLIAKPSEMIRQFPQALYLIANANVDFCHDISRQLKIAGIPWENICISPNINPFDVTDLTIIGERQNE